MCEAAARDALGNPEAEAEWIAAAVKACEAAYPGSDFQHWAAYEGLLPHARTLAELASDSIGLPWRPCSNRAGFYLDDRAAYADAEPLYERALAIREKALGPDHPDVATSLNNLAGLYAPRALRACLPLSERALAMKGEGFGAGGPRCRRL